MVVADIHNDFVQIDSIKNENQVEIKMVIRGRLYLLIESRTMWINSNKG